MEGGIVYLWFYVMIMSQVSWGSQSLTTALNHNTKDYSLIIPGHPMIQLFNQTIRKQTVDLTNNKNMYKHGACRRIINYATVEIERQEKKKLELDSCKNTSGQFSQM